MCAACFSPVFSIQVQRSIVDPAINNRASQRGYVTNSYPWSSFPPRRAHPGPGPHSCPRIPSPSGPAPDCDQERSGSGTAHILRTTTNPVDYGPFIKSNLPVSGLLSSKFGHVTRKFPGEQNSLSFQTDLGNEGKQERKETSQIKVQLGSEEGGRGQVSHIERRVFLR